MNRQEFVSEAAEGQTAVDAFVTPVAQAEATDLTMSEKWKAASTKWAKEVKLSYLSNPAARRDLRVQFRGNRSAPLFGLLVLVMVGLSLYLYWMMMKQSQSEEQIQDNLLKYCAIILGILGVAVALITPVLAAASILAEKQRRSLDLVFSSPIKPKAYLLGKLAASYRYVLVFMALSLPFTAMSIIMGGGTWWNILEAYFLLSLQGLLLTTIGLYFAALVEKTISALFYTYVAVIGYLWVAALFVVPQFNTNGMSDGIVPFLGGPFTFVASLVPFFVMFAAGTTTSILGIAVPNFLLAAAFTLVSVNLILSCASGLLSPLRQTERTSLRIKIAIIVGGISAALGFSGSFGNSEFANNLLGMQSLYPLLPLLVFLPFLACYGTDGERRQNHNKLFAVRDTFGHSIAGALPYIYMLIGVSSASIIGGALAAHKQIPNETLGYIAYAFGFWTFAWSTARFSSSFALGMKASRTLQFLTLAGVIGAPLPLFVSLTSHISGDPGLTRSIWQWFMLSPMLGQTNAAGALIHGLLLLSTGLGLATWSEKNYRRRAEKKKLAQMAQEEPLSATAYFPSIINNVSVE